MTPEAMQGLAALIVRIGLRYLAIPLAVWLGLPDDVTREVVQDVELNALLVMGVTLAIGAVVEAWTAWARKSGGKT
jgi:hypothetical protein